jgi:hypothetical protein
MLIGTSLMAQTSSWSHSGCLWRGFQHSWTYNHRCNRLGDYIERRGDDYYAVHTSATGKGPDSTYYNTYYTTVQSPDVWLWQGQTTTQLLGVEGRLLDETIEIQVPLPDSTGVDPLTTAFINGFDLNALAGADKLQLFRINIEQPEILPEKKKIRFLIKVSMVDNCKSLECKGFNNKTAYRIAIHYLVACGSKTQVVEHQDYSNRCMMWDKKILNANGSESRTVDVSQDSNKVAAILGIKSFGFVLDKAHWLVEFDANVQPGQYLPTRGTYRYDVDEALVEWEDGMKKFSPFPSQSRFAVKQKGWITMDMNAAILQMNHALVAHREIEGVMYWPGKNELPNDAQSLSTHKIPAGK